MESRIKLFLPQPHCAISQRCLLIFPGYTLFLPFITPLKLIVCKRFECVSVLVVARRSSQANRVCNTVGKTGGFCLLSSRTAFFRCSIDPSLRLSHTLGPFPITAAAVCARECVGEISLSTSCVPSAFSCIGRLPEKSAQPVNGDSNKGERLHVKSESDGASVFSILRSRGFASHDFQSKSNR